MDPLPTPLPVKGNNSKPKINSRVNIAVTGEPQRQNRVFGTTRNTNIPAKYMSDMTLTKTKVIVPHRKPKSITSTKPPFDTSTKKSPENVNHRINKKSDTFPQGVVEKTVSKNFKLQKESCSGEPKTPVIRAMKSEVVVTPFYSAAHCSKCRFDKFETSYYWVGQIKMAESVGKHRVACAFFKLAFESQAEPIRELRMELKRYLLRHEYLSELQEWREVGAKYGLLNVESVL
ncbi:PREDICTED: uncharacterized protein LOC109354039 [Lupinus angustifolius]|nr:PREDICTED: uncharacterized protein LOC109354039 [Lupinus angustifolius]